MGLLTLRKSGSLTFVPNLGHFSSYLVVMCNFHMIDFFFYLFCHVLWLSLGSLFFANEGPEGKGSVREDRSSCEECGGNNWNIMYEKRVYFH